MKYNCFKCASEEERYADCETYEPNLEEQESLYRATKPDCVYAQIALNDFQKYNNYLKTHPSPVNDETMKNANVTLIDMLKEHLGLEDKQNVTLQNRKEEKTKTCIKK